MPANAGVESGISLTDLYNDPYPYYARLRATDPVHWLPAAGRYLVTRHQDVVHLERHPEIFIANEEGSLMTRVMGHTMIRKDGEAHRRERAATEPALRPRVVKEHWQPTFERNTHDLIDSYIERGNADLFSDFAGPLAARNLACLLGLRNVTDTDLQTWSQSLIDGGGVNYGDDGAVWQRARTAASAIDDAIDDILPHVRRNPDESVISCMVHADDPLTLEEIRANVKVIVGGGLNEPRDAILTAAWAVLLDAQLRTDVTSDPSLWPRVFEESVRWIAPIGMYPRQVAQTVELGGVTLNPGDKLGVCLGSANRDETVFDRPDEFDIHRPKSSTHVAFGGGPHFCLGTWVARSSVGRTALPILFDRLPDLRLDPEKPVQVGGWVFRGLLTLPVLWSPGRA
ncbi:cytochrome P450 [Rhodococcus sp. IEGM 1304]|uniref:cytochrome P450 n=1 Tax=Rhodococcus sp. IEGM 1304 TaxID=3082227 RepID=UPI002954C3A5|nr:cytochrome P450 [Rhodococcus sp. IEGM 1304]MDV8128857.1 cytochrome P450 [Rhodococcus sp. IEGM 1304]